MGGASGASGYRIVVRGEIGPSLLGTLERVSIEASGDETVLYLDSRDQRTLRATLDRLGEAGIAVIALKRVH